MNSVAQPRTDVEAFRTRIQNWTSDQTKFLASIQEWTFDTDDVDAMLAYQVEAHDVARADLPTHYAVREAETVVVALGEKSLSDCKRLEEEWAGGLAWLVCNRRH